MGKTPDDAPLFPKPIEELTNRSLELLLFDWMESELGIPTINTKAVLAVLGVYTNQSFNRELGIQLARTPDVLIKKSEQLDEAMSLFTIQLFIDNFELLSQVQNINEYQITNLLDQAEITVDEFKVYLRESEILIVTAPSEWGELYEAWVLSESFMKPFNRSLLNTVEHSAEWQETEAVIASRVEYTKIVADGLAEYVSRFPRKTDESLREVYDRVCRDLGVEFELIVDAEKLLLRREISDREIVVVGKLGSRGR